MKKSKLLFIVLLFVNGWSYAQSVTISPNNGSSIIEAKATNKAVTLPIVSAAKAAITSPYKGMVLFEEASGTVSYYNGGEWVALNNTGSVGWALNGSNINNTNVSGVGIGTSAPNTRLHIINGASKSGVAPFSPASMSIDRNDGSAYLSFLGNDGFDSGILFGRTTGGGNDGGLIYTANKSLGFRTNDLPQMVITSTGYVGIGLASPSKKLHIHESAASKSNFIQISNTFTGRNTGMLIGVAANGRAGIYDVGAGIDINSGPIGLAFTPSTTPSGNAMEISDKGLFSSLLPDVDIVPLALGELKFKIETNTISGTSDYIISSINNYTKGNIITSISHSAKDYQPVRNRYDLIIFLDPNISSKYSKIIMYQNVDSAGESYLSPRYSNFSYSDPLNPYFHIDADFDFRKNAFIVPVNTDFKMNFTLYGIR